MKKIGYLRVSTEEQRPDRQIDGLENHCDELRIETVSAVAKTRPVFEKLLLELNAGDTLVVWDLDRAFRSTVDALNHSEDLRRRGVDFHVVTLGADTTTADGRLIYTVLAALAEHERARLSERTKQGLKAALSRGKRLGRPPKMNREQVLYASRQLKSGQATIAEIALANGVHPWTVTRAIRRTEE